MTTRPGSLQMTKLSTFSSSPAIIFPSRTSKRFLTWKSLVIQTQSLLTQNNSLPSTAFSLLPNRSLAQVRSEHLSELWFTASFPARLQSDRGDGRLHSTIGPGEPGKNGDLKSPDERTLRLGKTLRALSPLLPNIFTTPLPNELLNQNVSLHLFPSTHPHLPVVNRRVPCRAALWTAPMAWGSVPIVGNVKVEIMSEKMVRTGFVSAPTSPLAPESGNGDSLGEEKLVVRWKTEDKTNGGSGVSTIDDSTKPSPQSLSSSGGEINRGLSTLLGGSQPLFSTGPSDPFTGLFIFSFDTEGKIASMTIEHADENSGFDKTSRVVTLTDWLLGKARWGRVEGGLVPGLAYSGKQVWCRDAGQSTAERLNGRKREH